MVSYQQAIHAIGKASNGRGIYEGPGISTAVGAYIRVIAAPSMTG